MKAVKIISNNQIKRDKMSLRSILEHVSREIVFKRSLPKEMGGRKIFVSPGSALRYWNPSLKNADGNIYKVVSTLIKKDFVIWDVGANVGLFTFSSVSKAGPNGRCLAIEADIKMANLLRRTLSLNPDLNIDILPLAVSSENGVAEFNIAKRGRSTNFLSVSKGSDMTGGIRESYKVPTVTLDYLLDYFDKPNFLKVDVEGAELFVLKGSSKLLKIARPIIMIEINKNTAEDVKTILENNNYMVYDIDTYPEQKLKNLKDISDFLAIPNSIL